MDTKKKILVVDDSEINRMLLADMLSEQYDILEAENGMEASAILQKQESEISLMLLDIVMPVMDGFEMLTLMNKNGWIKSIPVIMISSETIPTYVDKAFDMGVLDYIRRPFDERMVRRRVISTLMLAAKQKELSNMVAAQIYEKEKDNRMMVEILSNIVEFRNGESGLHVLHIHILTELILKKLLEKTDKYSLTPKEIKLIRTASALHDIGKISVPSEILNKPGKLTAEEYEIMKTHAAEGAKMLESIPMQMDEPLIQAGYQICRWHHERYDGRGYPDGLCGDEIPIGAQVVALADVYDALTSKRVYKDAFSNEKAIQMICNGECGAFNPLLLECLLELADTLPKEMEASSLIENSEIEILDAFDDVMEDGELDASKRTLLLLEHEREKNKFYASISHDIQFEYTEEPEMLSLSAWGAERLEMPEMIPNPRESSFGTEIFKKEDFERLLENLKNTTVENPVLEEDYLLHIRGQEQWCKVIARAMWLEEKTLQYEGAIGKIIEGGTN